MTLKFLIKLLGVMRAPEMFSDHRMFMLPNALMEVAASVPNIICITQITCEFIYYSYTLVVDQGRLFLCDSQMNERSFCS